MLHDNSIIDGGAASWLMYELTLKTVAMYWVLSLWGAFRVHLRVDSAMAFGPICVQGLSRRRLGDVAHFRVEEKETKGYSKMAAGPTNQNCSFDCKWQPPMEAAIFEAELCSE